MPAVAAYGSEKVVNGTYGEVWVNDDYYAPVTGLEAKVALETVDVQRVRVQGKGKKIVGRSGAGMLKGNKVNSYFIKKLSGDLKNGKATTCDITFKLADPDAYGTEICTLKECTFSELTLADFEGGKNGEESIPFDFVDWDFKETIDHTFTAPTD